MLWARHLCASCMPLHCACLRTVCMYGTTSAVERRLLKRRVAASPRIRLPAVLPCCIGCTGVCVGHFVSRLFRLSGPCALLGVDAAGSCWDGMEPFWLEGVEVLRNALFTFLRSEQLMCPVPGGGRRSACMWHMLRTGGRRRSPRGHHRLLSCPQYCTGRDGGGGWWMTDEGHTCGDGRVDRNVCTGALGRGSFATTVLVFAHGCSPAAVDGDGRSWITTA
jgi:hypothetical protein